MIAVELSDQGILQYCPVRLYLRIVSASIFLLKSLSLGSREADISASLEALDRCIAALQNSRSDDIHLSNRYATLIARHVQRFRRNFRVKEKTFLPPTATSQRSQPITPFTSSGANAARYQEHQQQRQAQNPEASACTGDIVRGFSPELSQGVGSGALEEFDFGEYEITEDWLAQPFNPQIAPFGLEYMPAGAGIALDSLDFLWNISDQPSTTTQ